MSCYEDFVTCNSSANQSSVSSQQSFADISHLTLNTAFYDDSYDDDISDITTVSSLSKLSSCSEHFVRIEQYSLIGISDCSLIETHFIPDFQAEHGRDCSGLECSYLNDDHLAFDDWKNDTRSANADIAVLPEVEQLSDKLLRARLVEFGDTPGPIISTTRKTYEQRLTSYIQGEAKKAHAISGKVYFYN